MDSRFEGPVEAAPGTEVDSLDIHDVSADTIVSLPKSALIVAVRRALRRRHTPEARYARHQEGPRIEVRDL